MVKNIYKRIAAALALFTVELLLIWGLFLACIIFFVYLGTKVQELDVLGIDKIGFAFAARISSSVMDTIFEGITFFGSRNFLTPAALLLSAYFLFIRKHRWHSLKIPVVALGSITLNLLLKYLFSRPRPLLPEVEASGLSFPSGHTMVAASFYGLLIYLIWNTVRSVAWRNVLVLLLSLFIVLIGFSRVYFRVHFASDVLAGFAAGFLWLVFGLWMLRKMEKFSSREIDPALSDTTEAEESRERVEL